MQFPYGTLFSQAVQIYLIFKQKINVIPSALRIYQSGFFFHAYDLPFFAEQIVQIDLVIAQKKEVVIENNQSLPAKGQSGLKTVLIGPVKVKYAYFLFGTVHGKDHVCGIDDQVHRVNQRSGTVVCSSKGSFYRAVVVELVNFDVFLVQKEQFSSWTGGKTGRPQKVDVFVQGTQFGIEKIDFSGDFEIGVEQDQPAVHVVQHIDALPIGNRYFGGEVESFSPNSLAANRENGVVAGAFEIFAEFVLVGLEQIKIAFLIDFQIGTAGRNMRNGECGTGKQ